VQYILLVEFTDYLSDTNTYPILTQQPLLCPAARAVGMPISVFLGLSVLDLGPMYAKDRRQTDRRQMRTVNMQIPIRVGIPNI